MFSNCMGVVRLSTIHLCPHVGQQGDLRWHLLQQGVVACCSGYIPAEGDQPDGETNVPIFGVGIEHGSGDV